MQVLLLLLVTGLLLAQAEPSRPSFAEFLNGIKTEAVAHGIRQEIVDTALSGIEEPSALVIERDRSQAETVQTLEQYLTQRGTANAGATSGRRPLTCSRRLPTTCTAAAGAVARRGAGKSASRPTRVAASLTTSRAAMAHARRHAT